MSSQFNLTNYSNPAIQPLTITGTEFQDASGNNMRFWAANVVALYPDHATAEAFATNIAASGVNMVRLHHYMRQSLDWNWTSNIAALSDYSNNSSRCAPSGKDSVAWDRFDYLVSQLYAKGIYVMLSFDFSRTYLPGDVAIQSTTTTDQTAWSNAMQDLNGWASAAWNEVVDKWKMLPVIDERCALLQEEFITQLLTRNNTYIGNVYGNSNQILAIEILNEYSSFYTIVNGNKYQNTSHPNVSYFQDELISKWNAYLASVSQSSFDLYNPTTETQQAIRQAFLNKLDTDYRTRILNKVSSLGYSRNITFSNLWRSESDAKLHYENGPHSENHIYAPASIVDPMPYNSLFSSGTSTEPQEDFIYSIAVETAFSNKPFIIGEINYSVGTSSADTNTRLMMQLAASVYGAHQGWSAITWFAWNHGDRHVAANGWGTGETLTPTDEELGGDFIQDAARLDHFRTCAVLFRNDLLSASSSSTTFTVDDPVWNSFGWPPAPKYKFRPGWQNKSRVRKLYGTKPAGQDTSALMTQSLTTPIASDTSQIRKDTSRRQLTISTTKAEAFSGNLDTSAPGLLNRLSIVDTSGFATIVLVSADGQDLTTSERLQISRNTVLNGTWQAGPALKLISLKAATTTRRWYLRPLRPRDLTGVGVATEVTVDANGHLDLPVGAGWREAELIYMESPAIGAPANPSNLQVISVSAAQVGLSWTDNSTDEVGFLIERATDSSSTYSLIALTAADITSFADTTCSPGTSYSYRVRAVNAVGPSAFSNVVTAQTPNRILPATPTSPSAVAVSETQIDLSWGDASANENGFIIERAVGSGAFSVLAVVPPNTATFSDTNLTTGMTYSYRISAANESGVSSPTAEVSAVPSPAVPPLNFHNYSMTSFSTLDGSGTATIDPDTQMTLTGVAAKKWDKSGASSTKSVLEFDFLCTTLGTVHGIGWTEFNDETTAQRIFQLCGTQSPSWALQNYNNYTQIGTWKHYVIPIGEIYTGGWEGWKEFLAFVNLGGTSTSSAIRNVKIYDTP